MVEQVVFPQAETVTLLRSERRDCHDVAVKRAAVKDYTRRVTSIGYDDVDLYEMGLYAECAVGKFMGWDIDRVISEIGDGGRDFTLNGKSVAVKFSHKYGLLIIEERPGDDPKTFIKDASCDYIVVTQGPCPATCKNPATCQSIRGDGDIQINLLGWTTREVFLARHKPKMMRGPRFVLYPDFFFPMLAFPYDEERERLASLPIKGQW